MESSKGSASQLASSLGNEVQEAGFGQFEHQRNTHRLKAAILSAVDSCLRPSTRFILQSSPQLRSFLSPVVSVYSVVSFYFSFLRRFPNTTTSLFAAWCNFLQC